MNRSEHILVCLMEEASEVQKETSKILRFRLGDKNPFEHADYPSNKANLETELVQLFAMVKVAQHEGLLFAEDEKNLLFELFIRQHPSFGAKIIKFEDMLAYSRRRGTLQE
mgnify:CR=1 FL=1